MKRRLIESGYTPSALVVQRGYFISSVFELAPQSYSDLIAPVADLPAKWCDLDIHSLRRFTREWATRWHLPDSWCTETALALLLSRYQPDPLRLIALLNASGLARQIGSMPRLARWMEAMDYPPRWLQRVISSRVLHEPPFCFEHDGWNPVRSPRAAFTAEVLAAFKRELTAYCDRLERSALAAGLEETLRSGAQRITGGWPAINAAAGHRTR